MVKLDSKMFFFFEMFCIQEGEAFRTRYQKKKKKKWCDQTNISSLYSRGYKLLEPDLPLAFRTVSLPFTVLKNT